MKKENIYVIIFFAVFLFLGLLVYKDYGVSWDEPVQRETGMVSYNYFFNGNKSLDNYRDKYYGVAFELPLILIEKTLHLTDFRDIFLIRHFFTFLIFFISVYFFYRLCREHFNSWKIGLLGSFFLILSPRIFADAFYNSKDLVFLSFFIISIYSLKKWSEKKNYFRTFIHSLLCAILIDIRILGILAVFFSFFIFCKDFFLKKEERKKSAIIFLLFLILTILFVVGFWPVLWKSPITNFIEAFRTMGKYPWDGDVLYFGKEISASNLAWHYSLAWIIITTPVSYIIGFVLGIIFLITNFIRYRWKNYGFERKTDNIVFLLWFFLPLFSVIFLKSTLYDGWRQLYFIYPAFLLICIQGFVSFYLFIRNFGEKYKIINFIFIILVISGFCFTLFFMILNHPNQNVYFNFLVDRNEARNNFELDYWGLSYKQGLEYILNYDKRTKINIAVENLPGIYNSYIFNESERKRLNYVSKIGDSDYFLTNYRWHRKDYEYNEVYSVKVNGIKILGVYKF